MVLNNSSKLLCPSCPKKVVSEKHLGLNYESFILHLPELLSTTDYSNDFFFDLIGDFFYLSTLESPNLDNSVPNPSSLLTNQGDSVSSNKNKFNILHLNINSVLGLEKLLGLDSILASEKFDIVVIPESKNSTDTPDASFNYPSYQLIRRDHLLAAGGLLLFIIKSCKLILSEIDSMFESCQ